LVQRHSQKPGVFCLQGVVFDMDGVIIDSHPLHRAAWRQFLSKLGKDVDDMMLDFVLDGRTRKDILFHFLGPLTDEQLEEYGHRKDELLRNLADVVPTIPGVVEFLSRLSDAGVSMALATSASRHRACGTLKELGLAQHFQTIVTADEVVAGKPDPAIYRLASERLQVAPQNLLAVEDAVSGVKSATAAGIRCLGVAHNGRADLLRSAGANPVIEDFRSLSFTQLEACFQSNGEPLNSHP
jgi:HAD superfamily hydrolase (TIGR01509 family)